MSKEVKEHLISEAKYFLCKNRNIWDIPGTKETFETWDTNGVGQWRSQDFTNGGAQK